MDKAQKHNSDGYGVAWYEDEVVKTYKTFDYELFKKICITLESKTLVIHLRHTTRGDNSYYNIHPFDVPSGVMFHNGTLFGMKVSDTYSDSYQLAEIINECNYGYVNHIMPLITNYVNDRINRLVFLEDNGEVTIVNKELGITVGGCWYSNDYHLKDEGWCRSNPNPKVKAKGKNKVMELETIKKIGDITKPKIVEGEELKHRVFVYGTLKRGYSNNQFLRDSLFLGKASTVGKWNMVGKGYSFPYVMEQDEYNGKHIKGEVYAVSDCTLGRLDRLEGVPHHYVSKKVKVKYDDDSVATVNIYVKATIIENYLEKEELIEEWSK